MLPNSTISPPLSTQMVKSCFRRTNSQMTNYFNLLIQKLDFLSSDSFTRGFESLVPYGNSLVKFLVNKFYKVCVINPIQTSTMRKNFLRKTKTDIVDTYIIIKILIVNPHPLFNQHDFPLFIRKIPNESIQQKTQSKKLTSYFC